MKTNQHAKEEFVSMEQKFTPLEKDELEQFRGGFAEGDSSGISLFSNTDNSNCSDNGKCKHNGTCHGNGTCSNNGICSTTKPTQTIVTEV